jgi:hypothetical protein
MYGTVAVLYRCACFAWDCERYPYDFGNRRLYTAYGSGRRNCGFGTELCSMAISAEKAITLTEKSAKLAMNGSYGARYIGTFIILGVLMFFKIINPVTAVLPLFVPKIAYTVTAFKEKSDF